MGKCFGFPSNFSLAKCQVLIYFAISNQTSNETFCYKLAFHLVFGCSVVYLPYMDVSLVSCVNIPNIGQLPLLLKAKWRKPCKKGKTLLKLIARKNETEMTEPERASISREGQVARTSGKYNASKLSNLITKTSVQERISSLRFCQRSGACFSKVPKLFGRISDDVILFVSSKRRRLEARNFAVIFIFIPFTTYEKTSFTVQAGRSFTNGFSGPKSFRDF